MSLAKRFITGAIIVGSLAFSGCQRSPVETIYLPGETVTDTLYLPPDTVYVPAPETGDLKGKIIWDLEGYGIYRPSPEAVVTLDHAFYVITGIQKDSTIAGGGVECSDLVPGGYCTITDSEGNFSFSNIPEGKHAFDVLNFPTPNSIGKIYALYDDSVSVERDVQTDLGDIKIGEVNEIRVPRQF